VFENVIVALHNQKQLIAVLIEYPFRSIAAC